MQLLAGSRTCHKDQRHALSYRGNTRAVSWNVNLRVRLGLAAKFQGLGLLHDPVLSRKIGSGFLHSLLER